MTDTSDLQELDQLNRARRLQPGWAAALGCLLLTLGLAVGIVMTGEALPSIVLRLAIVAAVLTVGALVIGSEVLLALATAPVLGAAVAAVDASAGPTWGRSLLIGCLWFVAVELGWYAIQRRGRDMVPVEVTVQRIREVATVVTVTLAVGVVAVGAATFSPPRSLLVRALLAATLVGGLAAVLRQLTDSPESVPPETAAGTEPE